MPRTLCLMFLVCSAGVAPASAPPSDPQLRIDSGMHTSMVGAIAIDSRGRWLVTASLDKTARVWDLATGRLLSVLRPPAGPGDEGTLISVAMSPNGALIALGGNTQFNEGQPGRGSEGTSIYLFERASGQMLKRLSGVPDATFGLAFSPDARYLAATLRDRAGVRIYRCDTWSLVGQDSEYGQGTHGVDFSRDGRLVTSSRDGFVRLYSVNDSGLRLTAKQHAPSGRLLEGVRFSADGRSLAVAAADWPNVSVLDASTLALRYVAQGPGGKNGALSGPLSVAWSADDQTLYAAGKYSTNGNTIVRKWSSGGRSAPRDTEVTDNSVTDLRTLPAGGVVFGAAGPSWGVVDAQGRRAKFVAGSIAEFRAWRQTLEVSRDGTTVRFSYDRAGQELARFDLMQGLLRGGNSAGDLAPARTQAPGLNLAGWQNTPEPTLNGRPLRLYANENALAVAISPDGASFALGSAGRVRLYDRSGTVRWQVAGQGAAWAVNITGNGRTVVAGFADGTIHWYDIQNGREELAFFPFGDRKRWIAWTPSGYYQASVGGEDLIGWQLNRGGDAAADFFPASLFRSRFNRPDLIVHALSAPSEADALRMADADSGRKSDAHPVSVQTVLPPVVEIVAPADETAVTSPSVTLHYAARSPSDAPVTALRVRVNGQAVALQARGLSVEAKGNERELTVPIGEQDSQIELFAENKNGVSTPATVHLTWGGKKSATAWDAARKPKLYVLAVGVSKYQNVNFNLGLPAKDAHDFADVLRKQKGKLYADVQVRLLTDADATCDNVVSGLEWLANQVRQNDVGIMFLAGHGVNDNYGKYFFIPYNGDPSKLLLTGVAQNDIRDTLSKLVGKAVFFVDTCHAGNALGTAKGSGSETSVDAFVNDLSADENGVVVFAAATSRQFSLEDAAWVRPPATPYFPC